MKVSQADTNNHRKVEVDCEDQGEIFSHTFTSSDAKPLPAKFKKLKVGTAVRCRQYFDWHEAMKDGHNSTFVITQVYTKVKEGELQRQGAVFPDVPPDLRPNGYYG